VTGANYDSLHYEGSTVFFQNFIDPLFIGTTILPTGI